MQKREFLLLLKKENQFGKINKMAETKDILTKYKNIALVGASKNLEKTSSIVMKYLQNNGYKVALVTDGRMSGASGKVPAAIHLSPEASDGGILSKLKDGDPLILNAKTGELNCLNEKEVLNRAEAKNPFINQEGHGRELFSNLRKLASSSDNGASILF